MTDPFSALRAEHPGRFASPERVEQLSRERFKPWPAPKVSTEPAGPCRPKPATGTLGSFDYLDAGEWWHLAPGYCGQLGRGFVRDSRFGSGQVIPGTDRSKQRRELRKAQAAREPKR